ncbi:MAG: TetR/AcrR family transcriptional regulator [Minwuiales bacterium]|nr:TetR/AcrR family transcriptional regulator [Minwuiales bacterium]
MAVSADSAGQDKAGAPGRVRRRNRAKILQAAEHVFAERGYDGATTAAIADRAGLPKANVHYYFGTKNALYRAVIDNIMELWLQAFGDISEDSDPAEALSHYIRAKLAHSRERPLASRIFANEIVRGAPILSEYLKTELRDWVTEKSWVLKKWAKAGKMDPIDPVHLFFMIWSTTQTYADFDVQMRAVLGRRRLTDEDFDTAAETITRVILKGCGIVV